MHYWFDWKDETEDAVQIINENDMPESHKDFEMRAIMEEILLDLMYEIPDKTDVSEIIIDDKVVSGSKSPKYVHSRKKAV